MKQTILLIVFLSAFFSPSRAQVDSFNWDHNSMPHTFYTNIQLGQGNQLKYIDQFFNADTLFLDLIFSDCSAPATAYHWDSLIAIPSSQSTPQYNFVARLALDSNTIVNNCFIHPRWYDTIFSYFMPLDTEDIASADARHVKIWPNPSKFLLFLGGMSGRDVRIIILSANGQVLLQEKYKQGIDVSRLAPGLYFLSAEEEGVIAYGHFVKE